MSNHKSALNQPVTGLVTLYMCCHGYEA